MSTCTTTSNYRIQVPFSIIQCIHVGFAAGETTDKTNVWMVWSELTSQSEVNNQQKQQHQSTSLQTARPPKLQVLHCTVPGMALSSHFKCNCYMCYVSPQVMPKTLTHQLIPVALAHKTSWNKCCNIAIHKCPVHERIHAALRLQSQWRAAKFLVLS